MLRGLRQLFRSSWAQRTRVYACATAVMFVILTLSRFDPVQEKERAAVWVAFASGILALVSRALVVKAARPTGLTGESSRRPADVSRPVPADAVAVADSHASDLTRTLIK